MTSAQIAAGFRTGIPGSGEVRESLYITIQLKCYFYYKGRRIGSSGLNWARDWVSGFQWSAKTDRVL